MKLRNKKTGEIVEDTDILGLLASAKYDIPIYRSLAKINEEWEDYEEPKEYWYINSCGVVEVRSEEEQPTITDMHKQFSNYFETKEAAEKAVKKLEAWKRLKDQGTKVEGWLVRSDIDGTMINVGLSFDKMNKGIAKDLDLLFGGEE